MLVKNDYLHIYSKTYFVCFIVNKYLHQNVMQTNFAEENMKSKNFSLQENNEKEQQEAFVKQTKRRFALSLTGGLISGGLFFLGLLMAITGDISKTDAAISAASILGGWMGSTVSVMSASTAHETLESLEEEAETEL